jgi:hypothetical protein
MPTNIKLGLSLIALLVGAGVYYWENQASNAYLSWMVAGLTVFMVLAMWIFPETGGDKN